MVGHLRAAEQLHEVPRLRQAVALFPRLIMQNL